MNNTQLRERILLAAMEEFRKSGMKMTLQDIAGSMHIAKKTIYQYFESKEDLLNALLDYGFAEIHAQKKRIAASDLPVKEKIRRIMITMPEEYRRIDFRMLSGLEQRMPSVYENLTRHLETDWEPVIHCLEEGIAEGKIRSSIDLRILRLMMTAAFEKFLSTEDLKNMEIEYTDALGKMMDIIMDGISEDV